METKDYGIPTAKLLDVLRNDFVAPPEAAAVMDVAGFLDELVAAEQAGSLDDESYERLLRAFLEPLWRFGVDVRTPAARPPALTPPSFEREGDEVVLSFRQFVDDSALRLLQEHAEEINGAARLRVDLTEASEGALGNAYGLLSLLFSRPVVLSDLMGPRAVTTRYTVRNGACRLEQIVRLMNLVDEESRAQLAREAAHVQQCTEAVLAARQRAAEGAGAKDGQPASDETAFAKADPAVPAQEGAETSGGVGAPGVFAEGSLWVRENELYEPLQCPPAPEGLHVVLTAGPRTAAAAEQVVAIARRAVAAGASSVRIEGRTSGRSRYSNLLETPLCEGFSLVYPMTEELPPEPSAR